METRELADRRFRCLEGCGFCCTFQPEVSTRELALLRARFRPKPVAVAVGEGRSYLQLQNKCGACTLLTRRGCSAYDLRPAHCRYFPFHVHFGETPEVYVNWTCRGVEEAPGGDLSPEFQASVLSVASQDEVKEHERAARETYGAFRRKARKAGAWGETAPVVEAALAEGARVFTAAWVEAACARGGEPTPAAEALADALAPFQAEEVTKRPFFLAPDLRWLTFEAEAAPGAFRVLQMDEAGALAPAGRVAGLDAWEDLPSPVAEGLVPYLRRLTGRQIFTGGVYALVDDAEYEVTVEQAAWLRLAEVVVDLAVRARVLRALGTSEADLPAEVARFYDSTFLDAPTIGGFL